MVALCWAPAVAQVASDPPGGIEPIVPPEVSNVGFTADGALRWSPIDVAAHYNVYAGDGRALQAGVPGRCYAHPVGETAIAIRETPAPGSYTFFLVTAETDAAEGSPGSDSQGDERSLLGHCAPVMRNHVLNRVAYGWDPYTDGRLDTLGPAGFIAEQTDPDSIDESTNDELNSRLALLTPPTDAIQLIGRQIVSARYARRQLEQRMAMFWANHFNTYYPKTQPFFTVRYPDCVTGLPYCDPNFPAIAFELAADVHLQDIENFRDTAFHGNFREIVEESALGPAMLLFLDTVGSVAEAPNENFPRELLELYAMGVNGGYTQQDVEELSRVFTGWDICYKNDSFGTGPTDPCIEFWWTTTGTWVANFTPANHDCGAKTLFAGTPYERTIPDSCGNEVQAANDVSLALDAIVDHPSTARFISTKILKYLLTENPTEAQIDAVVEVWNDPSRPAGVGDLQAVTRAALEQATFLDPRRIKDKIKTPFEHMVGGLRATEGWTDGLDTVPILLLLHQQIPFYNPIPTGYSETGSSWIDTNNVLQRENFGIYLVASITPTFGTNPVGLLQANGISTAPGNAEAIVDFFADRLFAGSWTPAERDLALTYMNTDDLGAVAPYDDVRILEILALLMGLPQFQEQ